MVNVWPRVWEKRRQKAWAALALALLLGACARKAEFSAQAQGPSLVLHLANGRTMTLRGDTAGCQDGYEHCISHRLNPAPAACRCFSIADVGYEGGSFFLIDADSGRPTDLPYEPSFSPDGKRLIILNSDITGDFPGDTVEIWRREGDRAVPEWQANPIELERDMLISPKVIGWTDNTVTFSFLRAHAGANDADKPWTGIATRGPDGWRGDFLVSRN